MNLFKNIKVPVKRSQAQTVHMLWKTASLRKRKNISKTGAKARARMESAARRSSVSNWNSF